MATVQCPHGNPVAALEVTAIGDRRPVYVAGPCNCPRPHCPLCGYELGTDGRCWGDIECALNRRLVPNPELR